MAQLDTGTLFPDEGRGADVRRALAYCAIRLFCSTFTRLSLQKVQLGP